MLYWKNSAFQTVAFIAARCHTADEAYRRIVLAVEDRERAVTKNVSARMRAEARLEKAKHEKDQAATPWERKEAEASILEIESDLKYNEKLEDGANEELSFLREVLERLEPYRRYREFDDNKAFEKVQREEWLYEFIRRAENHIASTGTIPPAQLDAMRSHPDFGDVILPAIKSLVEAKKANKQAALPEPNVAFKKCFEEFHDKQHMLGSGQSGLI